MAPQLYDTAMQNQFTLRNRLQFGSEIGNILKNNTVTPTSSNKSYEDALECTGLLPTTFLKSMAVFELCGNEKKL